MRCGLDLIERFGPQPFNGVTSTGIAMFLILHSREIWFILDTGTEIPMLKS
jgi:hypothetical protein